MTVDGATGSLLPEFMRADAHAKTTGRRAELPKGPSFTLSSRSRVLPFFPALACLLIAGCAVGPNFKRPSAPDVSGYTAAPLATTAATANVAAGDAQRFDKGGDIPSDWWTLFHSKPLNDLIEESLVNNHDLKAAQAALKAAHENVLAQRGAYYPQITGNFSATRQSQSASLAPIQSVGIQIREVPPSTAQRQIERGGVGVTRGLGLHEIDLRLLVGLLRVQQRKRIDVAVL